MKSPNPQISQMRSSLFILVALVSFSLFSQENSTDCLSQVNGFVINKISKEIMPKAIIQLKKNGSIISKKFADKNGYFTFDIDCVSRYQISAQYENFTKNTKLIFASSTTSKHDIKLELFPIKEFTKVKNENRIMLDPIEFLPDDYSITPKAAKQLIIVYALLEKYQYINLDIRFHTASRGNEKFLLNLTQKRADACANYLIKRGIEASRIFPKGYGATQLLNRCKKDVNCSNLEHLENKRSEFIVKREGDLSFR